MSAPSANDEEVRAMHTRQLILAGSVMAVVAGGGLGVAQHAARLGGAGAPASYRMASASLLTRAGLPSAETAKAALSTALAGTRHPQWIDIPVGSTTVRSFVVFPDRREANAPVVVLTANNQGMSDWLRAVGDDAASDGFVAVVPDLLTGLGPHGGGTDAFAGPDAALRTLVAQRDEIDRRSAAVTQYAVAMPGSNGNAAHVHFTFENGNGRIETTVVSSTAAPSHHRTLAPSNLRTVTYPLTDHAWHQATASLSAQIDVPVTPILQPAPRLASGQAGRAGQAGRGAGAAAPIPTTGMNGKRPDLPANFLMAAKVVAQSPRKGEWVDIPMKSGVRLHTWISYPQNVAKAPVVLVFQPGPGMDMGEPIVRGGGANWLRAIADQLASEGFIGVLPDLTSGLGPNGGNHDSFEFPDEAGRSLSKISHAEVLDRIRVARDYALNLPMANGKLGATGFCMGGGLAWEAAAEIEGVNASVVFYGNPPAEPVMARITAPVTAFFGANDLGLAPRVAPAAADMKRLGKDFEVQVYPEATHVFLYRQDLGRNAAATEDAWPRAMTFFKRHLLTAATR
jgi:carboxymethylenebutenolidase